MKLTLNNKEDLKQAAGIVTWLNRPAIDQVLVSLHWLDKREQKRSEKALMFYFNDCGCIWGAPAFVLTFAGLFLTSIREVGFRWIVLGLSIFIGVIVEVISRQIGIDQQVHRLVVQVVGHQVQGSAYKAQRIQDDRLCALATADLPVTGFDLRIDLFDQGNLLADPSHDP